MRALARRQYAPVTRVQSSAMGFGRAAITARLVSPARET